MKSKEELNALKEEVETVSRKLAELTEEDLSQITAGMKLATEDDSSWYRVLVDFFFNIKP